MFEDDFVEYVNELTRLDLVRGTIYRSRIHIKRVESIIWWVKDLRRRLNSEDLELDDVTKDRINSWYLDTILFELDKELDECKLDRDCAIDEYLVMLENL